MNWFKNNGIEITPVSNGGGGTEARGGIIKFSDGHMGIIDMWADGKMIETVEGNVKQV